MSPEIDTNASYEADSHTDSLLPIYRTKGRSLGIAFEHVEVLGQVAATGGILDLPSMVSKLVTLPLRWMLSASGRQSAPSKSIVQDITGVVYPGDMMLVLGRPGSGCSTVLKALANYHESFVHVRGRISYANISSQDMAKFHRSEAIYASEEDIHFPTLTTRNTMDFGYKLRKPATEEKSDAEFVSENSTRMLKSLGIAHTKDTMVGDAFIRGVSGGERKRITLGEALSINSAYGSWDNPIRGLDSSSALQFLRLLKSISRQTGMTNSVSLYQASESMYEVFDRVMVLYEGRMIFCGGSQKAKQYFEDLGFECPGRQSTPDFLTGITSPIERKIRKDFSKPVPQDPDSLERAFRDSESYGHLLANIEQYYAHVAENQQYTTSFKQETQSLRSRFTARTSAAPRSIIKQSVVAAARYYQLLWGDRRTFVTVLAFNIVNAVINGSAYYMAPKTATGSFEKSGALFFSLIYFFLNALAETAATVNSRSVLLKQLNYGFIHPVSYVFAQTIADIPVAAFQTLIFSCMYYFMLGLVLDVSDFWVFALFVFVHYGAVQAMFRMLGAWSPNLSIALLMAGSGMPVSLLYSGYAPTIPTMHNWGSWIRRICPSPWALEGLMANEFADLDLECTPAQMVPSGARYHDLRYQGCTIQGSTKGSDIVPGVTYLDKVYKYTPSHIWRNFGIIIGLWFLYTAIAAIGLTVMTRESSNSSSRIFKKEALPGVPCKSATQDPEKAVGPNSFFPSPSDTEGDVQSLEKSFSSSPQGPHTLFTFDKLSYYVNSGGSEKRLLTHVSGYARPGQLTALMGASGAGKTTLLDTIAQRKSDGRVEGEMLLNGKPLDRTFARSCGFVLQQDVHEPTATVREALQFSARMRQPKDTPDSEKMSYVEHIIRLLDLEMLSEAIVGETGDGMLSVEERKRVTIGVELAARPSALFFLDEPTSGLDSQAAYALVEFLKKIAAEGLPIVCTIHQPSGVLFDMFDHILLLAPGGKTVFFGETGDNSANVVNYFDRYGAHIGANDNPAEFILSTVTDNKSSRDWVSTWDNSPESKELQRKIAALNTQRLTTSSQEKGQAESQYSLGQWQQTVELTKRHWTSVWRNGPYNFSRLFKAIFCEMFIAFSFFKANTDVQGLQNHMLAMLLLSWIIPATAADIQDIWFQKWDIFAAREKNGIYKWSALLTALIVVEIPWQICFYTIVFFCSYWTVGFPNTPTLAGFQYFMFILLSFFGTGYSQLLAALFPSRAIASYANSLFWVILMLFSGVLVPHSSMNAFYRPWLFWADPMRYFFGGSVSNILHGVKAQCTPMDSIFFDPPHGQTCAQYAAAFLESSTGYLSNPSATSNCSFCPYTTGDDYTATLDYFYCDKWRDLAVFLGFCLTNNASLYVIMWWREGRSQR